MTCIFPTFAYLFTTHLLRDETTVICRPYLQDTTSLLVSVKNQKTHDMHCRKKSSPSCIQLQIPSSVCSRLVLSQKSFLTSSCKPPIHGHLSTTCLASLQLRNPIFVVCACISG